MTGPEELAVRQAWDGVAFSRDVLNGLERYCPEHDLFDCPFAHAPCPTCRGTGRVPHPDLPYTRNVPCPTCKQAKP